MSLPNTKKSILKKQKGQILVLFLLILVVGLAIVLSVASRTVTDIRTTTTSDESNRAYFAAEAGVEEALRQIDLGNTDSFPLKLSFTASNSQAETSLSEGVSGYQYIYPFDLQKDQVAQVMMAVDIDGDRDIDLDDLNSGGGWDHTDITVFWSGVDSPDLANEAIEVSILTYNGSSFGLTKAAFDPNTTRGNNFCAPTGVGSYPVTDNVLVPASGARSETFRYYANFALRGSAGGDLIPGCNDAFHGNQIDSDDRVVLIRLKAMYNQSSQVPVAVRGDEGSDIPVQGFVVQSTGRTASGVTRKIEVIKLYSALSGLFDYVLFNGGNWPIMKTDF